jgi:predicted small metal-binding protein
LIRKVADHVRKVHKVHTPTETIVSFVKQNVRQ